MNIFSRMLNFQENRLKKETLLSLRSMSDRQLHDCGLSPELLNEGIKAWPWRELTETTPPPFRFDHLATTQLEQQPVKKPDRRRKQQPIIKKQKPASKKVRDLQRDAA